MAGGAQVSAGTLAVGMDGQAGGLLQSFGAVIKKLGGVQNALALTGAGLGALYGVHMAKSIEEAQKFETELANLQKLLGEDIAQPIADSVRSLSNELPIAREKLSQVAETAARLGIRGRDDIIEFTETMGMVGVATDTTAQKASQDFARIAAMTDTPISQIRELTSAANALSNTAAASFSEISDAARRSSAALSNLGVGTPEILAINTALTEVSASARRSGTRLRRLAQEIQETPAQRLAEAFTDLEAAQVAALQRNNPTKLIRELSLAMREGGRSAKILREQFGSATETALVGLASNMDSLNQHLDSANSEFQDANSLLEEYQMFASTSEAKTQLMRNSIDNLQSEMGQKWLPAVKEVTEAIARMNSAMLEFITLPTEEVFPHEEAETFNQQLREIFEEEAVIDPISALTQAFSDPDQIENINNELARLGKGVSPENMVEFNNFVENLLENAQEAGDVTERELIFRLRNFKFALESTTEEGNVYTTALERIKEATGDLRTEANATGEQVDTFNGMIHKALNQLTTDELRNFGSILESMDLSTMDAGEALEYIRSQLKELGVEFNQVAPLAERFDQAMNDLWNAGQITGNQFDKLEERFGAVRDQLPKDEADALREQFIRLVNQGANFGNILEFITASARASGVEFDSLNENVSQFIEKLREAEHPIAVFWERMSQPLPTQVDPLTGEVPDIVTDAWIERQRRKIGQGADEGLTEAEQIMQRARERFDLTTMQAQMDMLRRTTQEMGTAFAESFQALFDETKNAEEALNDLLDTLSSQLLQRFFQTMLFNVGAGALFPETSGGISFLGIGGGRRHGGPVDAGMAYPVGESGTEMFVPGASGTIIPNDKLGGGGQVVVEVQQNFQLSAIDERGMEEMIQRNRGSIGRAAVQAIESSEIATRRVNARGRR